VTDLCRSMAIIHLGQVVVEGDPQDLARSLRGLIWQKLIPRADLAAHKERLNIISSRLVMGRTLIRVHGESAPEEGFEPVEPDLEDLYFFKVTGAPQAVAAAN